MSLLKLENFTGMIPSRANTLLPDTAAVYAQNAWLFHGDIRGFRQPRAVATLNAAITEAVYRVPDPNVPAYDLTNSLWLEFDDPDMCVIHAPTIDDQFERYYFISPTEAPQYNTRERLALGQPNFILGIPAPVTAPTVAVTGTDTTAPVTRAYVYTYVSAYGEEGQPSPAVVQAGSEKNTWTVTIPAPAAAATASRNITKVNIYRTIADGAGSSTYFLAGTVPLNTTTFVDSKVDTAMTGALQLGSTNWNGPPNDLVGAIQLPNGIIAGWNSKHEIWFCEPYRPHAWPSIYTISVPYPIVGCGRAAQNLVVCTEGNPYVVTGIHPSTMAMSAVALKEPCVSRRSIVSTEEGVYYASENGMVLIPFGYAQGQLATAQLFSRQRWAALQPQLLMGARMNGAYLGFIRRGVVIAGATYDGSILPGSQGSAPTDGLVFDALASGASLDGIRTQFLANSDQMDNGLVLGGKLPNTTYTRAKFTGLVDSLFQDEYSGEIFIVSGGKVWWWDPPEEKTFMPFIWQSKVFQFPAKQSFMAAKIFFTKYDDFGDVRPSPQSIPAPATDLKFDPAAHLVLFRVWADGRHVFTRAIKESGELIMLPSGFKADLWQIEVEGQVLVANIQIANSVKELAGA